MDNKRHGFRLSAPKRIKLTEEICDKALEAAEKCPGVHGVRFNKKHKALVVTFNTIRPAAGADKKLMQYMAKIRESASKAMLQEHRSAKKRARVARAAERSAKKSKARNKTGYLNRPGASTSPTL